MFDKMKQLMELKKQAEQLKSELHRTQIEVNEVPGIRISISGSQDFSSIEIDEQLLSVENKAKIESELLQSINAAVKKSQDLAAQKMQGIMPGLPGL